MEIRDHCLTGVRQCPSPNCDARPEGAAVELVVVHGISLPPGCFGAADVEALFCNRLDVGAHPDYDSLRDVRVSSHLLVHRTGACVQFVPFDRRAWHAGVSSWRGRKGCNDFSVGIELEGTDTLAYTDAQYAVLGQVLRALRSAYGSLPEHAVAGHADIAPGRKTDPGPAFDWARLRAVSA
jgi:AmpD protein